MRKELNQWLAFLDGERGDLIEKAKEENKMVEEAEKEYNVLTGDEELRRLEEIRLMSELEEHSALLAAKEEGEKLGLQKGKNEGKREGKAIGLKEGEKKSKKEITKKLLEKGMSIDEIEEITGLKKKEIEELI